MCGIIFWRSGFLLKALQRSLGFLFFFFSFFFAPVHIPVFISAPLSSSSVALAASAHTRLIYGADKKKKRAFCFPGAAIVFQLLRSRSSPEVSTLYLLSMAEGHDLIGAPSQLLDRRSVSNLQVGDKKALWRL